MRVGNKFANFSRNLRERERERIIHEMGRSPCSQEGLNKGTWTAQEDKLLTDYIKAHGEGKWAKVHRDTG